MSAGTGAITLPMGGVQLKFPGKWLFYNDGAFPAVENVETKLSVREEGAGSGSASLPAQHCDFGHKLHSEMERP